MGQFLPADHSKGDANTLGGYIAVHNRPAAFEGRDGVSYSVEIVTDSGVPRDDAFSSYILFIRWREGDPVASGHLETPYLSSGKTEAESRQPIERMKLSEVRAELDKLIRDPEKSRPWYDVARDEGGD
jgi:hypothetical protein